MEANIRPGLRRQGGPVATVRDATGTLRVALVHDWLTGMRGGEKCLEVLCRAFPEATLHTLIHRPGALTPTIERMRIRTSPLQRIPGVLNHYRKLLPIMPLAARAWRPGGVDLVVSLSHCVAKSVRVPRGTPHVCYCFTPMRYAWEGRESYLDTWGERPLRKALARGLLGGMRAWDRATASRVSHFVAISETIRRRIAACYGRESVVIAPPVDTDYYTPGEPVDRSTAPYLVVSALVAYKRVDQAVAACTATGRPLVVLGEGPERPRLMRMAGPNVSFLGWQPDEVIRDHYRLCRALLFPGEEDFGIVPVEALACGAPVIALGRGGVAETVTDRLGMTYPDASPEGLARALDAWEAAGGPFDAALARRRAESFATHVFRERLLGYLARVAGRETHPFPPAPHVAV